MRTAIKAVMKPPFQGIIQTSGWPCILWSTLLGTPSTNGDHIQPVIPTMRFVNRWLLRTFVQIMCIQPPLLSVGVLQAGQGLLITLIVSELGSAPFHLAPNALGSVVSKLQRQIK